MPRSDSLLVLAERAAPDLSDPSRALHLIRHQLSEEPALADAWQTFSYDNRGSPSAYLDDLEVGFFDGQRRDVVTHLDRLDACADFILRKARSWTR